jgi:hypothetical protein
MEHLLKPDFFYWFLIPTVISLFVFTKSIMTLNKKRNLTNWIITTLILISILFSESILYTVFFFDAWPTYLPYLVMSFAFIIYIIQLYLNKETVTKKSL